MGRSTVALTLGLMLGPALAAPVAAQNVSQAITEQEAHAIGVDAYVYFYSLVTMDISRKQFTNIEPGKEFGKGPMNMFVSVPEYPPADFKGVVRSNFDTLYSIVWLDLTKEPMVISAPDTSGRYYLLPMLDMWTDVFASPGWRTTGTQAGNYLVTPPGWNGTVPEGMTRIGAPTPYVWVIGRTKTDGPADYDAVHKIQAGYKATPLSEWGKTPRPPEVKIDPSVDMKTPPKVQVDTMPAGKYFAYAAELLKMHPPHITDEPIVAQMKRIGIEPGRSFDIEKVPPAVRKGLEAAPEAGQKLMEWKVPTLARVANHWSMNTDTMGVYGNYYLKRAIVSQLGLGANLPEDAIYPLNLGDEGSSFGRREQIRDPLRQRGHATRASLLVDHALRFGGISSWKQPQSLRGEQLDAFQIQCRRLPRPLLPEWKPWQGQGNELATCAEGALQSHHASLQSEIRGADRQMESATHCQNAGTTGSDGAVNILFNLQRRPVTGVHRPRVRQAVDAAGAPACDPQETLAS